MSQLRDWVTVDMSHTMPSKIVMQNLEPSFASVELFPT